MHAEDIERYKKLLKEKDRIIKELEVSITNEKIWKRKKSRETKKNPY